MRDPLGAYFEWLAGITDRLYDRYENFTIVLTAAICVIMVTWVIPFLFLVWVIQRLW